MNPSTGKPVVTHGTSRLSNADIRDLLVRHGFANVDAWVAIVLRESGGDPAVTTDTRGMSDAELHAYWGPRFDGKKLATEYSVGLFQVNVLANPGFDPSTLTDPDASAQAAYALSRGGTNFAPWGGRPKGT
jgi:Lysozyme like domain